MFDQMSFIRNLYPLHRTLVSDDIDLSLEIIRGHLPSRFLKDFQIIQVPSGTKCWTWKAPKKYTVQEAYIERISDGARIADFHINALHLVSYSRPIDRICSYEELIGHLFYSKKRPNALPWKFYYYVDDWGFCISYNQFQKLSVDDTFRVVIDCEFIDDALKIGELLIKGVSDDELLIVTNICHPYQVNDSITGVSAILNVLHHLSEDDLQKTFRILFLPETIGSICYFAQDEKRAEKIKYGIFTEMLGNDNTLALQHSFQKDTLIDTLAEYALKDIVGDNYRKGDFRTIVGNDELVTNGPGLGIPTVSISRSKITLDSFDEYHTSDDNPLMLIENNLDEAAHVIEKIIKLFDENYTPKRLFKGPVFLSGFGLWGIWDDIPNGKEFLDQLMYHLEGDLSVFEIAQKIKLDYKNTKRILDAFYSHGLIEKI